MKILFHMLLQAILNRAEMPLARILLLELYLLLNRMMAKVDARLLAHYLVLRTDIPVLNGRLLLHVYLQQRVVLMKQPVMQLNKWQVDHRSLVIIKHALYTQVKNFLLIIFIIIYMSDTINNYNYSAWNLSKAKYKGP